MSTTESVSTDVPSGNYDADELGQYRSLSSLAVVAFVFGLASVITFAAPLLVVVPLTAAALALLALRSIAASDGGLTGSRLALCGLALAIFFAVGAYARVGMRDSILQGQVDRTCRQWLDSASRGQVDQMIEMMTQKAAEKLNPPVAVGDPGSFFSGMLNSALMRQSPIIADVTRLRGDGELRFRIEDTEIYATSKPAQAAMSYSVGSSSSKERLSCSIGLRRLLASGGRRVWMIDSWSVE
ncbi:MAG: hypothetical protein AAGD11_08970 [Planctomycetota bacterium]